MVRWLVGETIQDSKEGPQQDIGPVVFLEIDPSCRFEILQRVGDILKGSRRFKRGRDQFLRKALIHLVRTTPDMSTIELQTTLDLLKLGITFEECIHQALTNKLRKLVLEGSRWDEIFTLMGERPRAIKEIVWGFLSEIEREAIREIKSRLSATV